MFLGVGRFFTRFVERLAKNSSNISQIDKGKITHPLLNGPFNAYPKKNVFMRSPFYAFCTGKLALLISINQTNNIFYETNIIHNSNYIQKTQHTMENRNRHDPLRQPPLVRT